METKVEVKIYDLEYYTIKENLKVDFAEELDNEEASTMGEESQLLLSNPKDQADSH